MPCSLSPVLAPRSRMVTPPTPGSQPVPSGSGAAVVHENSPLPVSLFASLNNGLHWSPSVETGRQDLLPAESVNNSPFKGLSNISLSPDTQRRLDSISNPAPTFGVPP